MTLDSDNFRLVGQQLISDLDTLQMDPYISNVLKDVEILNELLRSEPKTEEEIKELMRDVDSRWIELIDEFVRFTGRATFPDVSIPGGGNVENYYENEEMMFGGIIPYRLVDDDEGEYRLYELRVVFEREAIDSEGRHVILRGLATTTDIAEIEHSNLMSIERAKKILEHYEPDILEDIEVALLNPSQDESNMIMGLQGYILTAADRDDENIQTVKKALNTLCRNYVQLDVYNSYIMSINGRGWIADSNTYSLCNIEASGLVHIEEVIWELSPDDRHDTIVPHVAIRILGLEVNSTSDKQYAVPLTSISDLRSLRMAFYLSE